MPAYNYYGQPFGNQFGAFPQSFQPQAMQQPQVAQSQPSVQQIPFQQISNVWIYNESEIVNYPVAPNNAVRFWVANKPVFYEKSADATGKPSIRVFDYTERKETASDSVSTQGDKLPSYATKEELCAIVDAMKGIASEIETMKGDLYGVAGRKKSTKKVEAIEDDA